MTLSRSALLPPAAVLLAAIAPAQAPNEFDFDTTKLAVTDITPSVGATLTITAPTLYTGQNLRLNAHLIVQSGGELVLDRSRLSVHGDIRLLPGGRITVLDSTIEIDSDNSSQFTLWNEGGLLHTERAVLGGTYDTNSVHQIVFMHLRGTWLARQTTMQAVGVVIADGPTGWYGNPNHRGGSIFADGLYLGDYADAIHMVGLGDAVLANGTMNVGLYYDAAAAGQANAVTFDLENAAPLDIVYGDPSIHEGVTHPIAGALCRLQLAHHRSPTWQFFVLNATQSGPLCTLTLRNTEDAIVGIRCNNLIGSPVLAGPWSNWYSELPGLPSTQRPGFHPIPPTCSVQIGNVVFRSDVNEWSRILAWGLYFNGTGTNFTVTGPSAIAEVKSWGGQVNLRGVRSYDLGLQSGVTYLFNNATMTLDNVALGTLDPSLGLVGDLEANDTSSCTISQSRAAPIRLRATAPGAAISAQQIIGVENVVPQSYGGGTVQVNQANAGQNWDLQNLSMDAPGAGVPYWAVSGLASTLVADGAPGAPGSTSRQLVAGAGGGWLRKSLTLPTETYVTVVASTKLTQLTGAAPTLRVTQGGNVVSAPISTTLGAWRRVHVPMLTVTGTGPTVVELVVPGAATVQLDDVRLRVNSWWDNENLANLGFEGSFRHTQGGPLYCRTPDTWWTSLANCEPDTAVVRPGAAAGSRSVRATMPRNYGVIYKDLTFLRPGDVVVVTGWMRGSPTGINAGMAAQIGDGANWSLPTGNNQQVILPCNGLWHSFTLNYTVPPNPTTTRLGLSGWSATGSQCWFDDLTVSIQ